jgi:hypothetical protein
VRGARKGKFKAQITMNGMMKYLGQFNTAEEAHAVWWAAYRDMNPEFGRKN